MTGDEHPVTAEDHEQPWWATLVAEAKRRAASGEGSTVKDPFRETRSRVPSRPGVARPTLFVPCCYGVVGYAAGPDVRIVDHVSLGDPIGSHFRLESVAGPGTRSSWKASGRSPASAIPSGGPRAGDKDDVAAAERAISCGTLHDVMRDHGADERVAVLRQPRSRSPRDQPAVRRGARCRRARAVRGRAHSREALVVAEVFTALALALRFLGLAEGDFWGDELATHNAVVDTTPSEVLAIVQDQEGAPHPYYLLAWAWSGILGGGEAALRSLSAIAGALVAPVAYLTLRQVDLRTEALIAGALAAVSPLLIWYSQEARMYSLFALMTAVALLFFVRLLVDFTRER